LFEKWISKRLMTLGKRADHYVVCHKAETQKDMGKAREAI
jgi:hypothetical protein